MLLSLTYKIKRNIILKKTLKMNLSNHFNSMQSNTMNDICGNKIGFDPMRPAPQNGVRSFLHAVPRAEALG